MIDTLTTADCLNVIDAMEATSPYSKPVHGIFTVLVFAGQGVYSPA